MQDIDSLVKLSDRLECRNIVLFLILLDHDFERQLACDFDFILACYHKSEIGPATDQIQLCLHVLVKNNLLRLYFILSITRSKLAFLICAPAEQLLLLSD